MELCRTMKSRIFIASAPKPGRPTGSVFPWLLGLYSAVHAEIDLAFAPTRPTYSHMGRHVAASKGPAKAHRWAQMGLAA